MTKEQESQMEKFEYRIPKLKRMERGQIVKGTVVSIGASHAFLDIGMKSEASLDIKEITDGEGKISYKLGDKIEAYIVETDPEVVLSFALARAQLNLDALEDAHDMGIPVEGRVTAVNKGGFDVDFNGVRAFCPISQIELGYCENGSAYLDRVLQFRVMEFAEHGRNIIVSRRAILEEERQEAAAAVQEMLHEGAEFEGEVVSVQPYGAFVDIGGIQGMVHISEITHSHIEHPQEALQVGQKVRVKVMRIERDPKHADRQRIGLSIRALLGDPWEKAQGSLVEGATIEGKVIRIQPFGAFVSIAPGIDGLIHISEISEQRIKHPNDVLSVGQTVKATILKIDPATQRISLSLRGQDAPGLEEMAVGEVVEVVVDKVKPFGLLVHVKGGSRNARGLIPAEETGVAQTTNLRKAFPDGVELKAMVSSIELDTGKMRFSIKAMNEIAEGDDYRKFLGGPTKEETSSALPKKEEKGFGSLGDLLMRSMNKTDSVKKKKQ